MIAAACWACIVALHEECYSPEIVEDDNIDGSWVTCCCKGTDHDEDTWTSLGVGRPVAEPSEITDITSTGRKRAAMLYPIYEGMECEWAWLKYAGGGVKPIIGCAGNTIDPVKSGPRAGHRHHGPDKNVIANAPGNMHRICASCHNRWHSLNNRYYGPRPAADQPYLPLEEFKQHDPETQATDEEREENETWWATKPAERIDIDD